MGGGASKKSDSKAVSTAKAEPQPQAKSPAAATAPLPKELPSSPAQRTPRDVTENLSQPSEVLRPGARPPKDVSSSPSVPSASAIKGSAFDVPDDEFTRILHDTFGPMVPTALMSTKWDRKVEAIKNVTEILKKKLVEPSLLATSTEKQMIDANNNACFRAACLVMERSACDKILPVLLASHELLRAAFQQAGNVIPREELHKSLDRLLAHVWPKVGDSNIRLHDSAKTTIIFAAGLRFYSIPVVLERLQGLISEKSRGHMRAKQISGVVDTVCSLVEHFPGSTATTLTQGTQMWTMCQITPFIENGLDDVVGPRTRVGAVKLAGAAFSKLGRDAMTPLLVTVRPAVRNLLLQKFDELEQCPDDDPELEDVPEVEQTKVRQPLNARPPTGSKRPATGGARPPTGGARPTGPTTGGAKPPTGQKPPLAKSKAVKAPSVPKPTPETDSVVIKAPETPKAPKAFPSGPSPRQKRFTPETLDHKGLTPTHKIFTPGSPTPCQPLPKKFISAMSSQEEDIMDQILEETGLVFGKSEKLAVGLEEEIEDLGFGGMAISCC
jgi:hypothetical protein